MSIFTTANNAPTLFNALAYNTSPGDNVLTYSNQNISGVKSFTDNINLGDDENDVITVAGSAIFNSAIFNNITANGTTQLGNVNVTGNLNTTSNAIFGDTESDQTVVNSYTWLKNDVRFGNDELTDTLVNQCRSDFQARTVFRDFINGYIGQTDIYATQGLYLGSFSNGRAVLGCPNNGTSNGFQFCNLDKDGNILNSPFYITQEGVCVTNGKLQVSADEFKVVDGALVSLPVNSVSQLAVNNLTTDLTTLQNGINDNSLNITTLQNEIILKANDDEVVKLTGQQNISGRKTFTGEMTFEKIAQFDEGVNILGSITVPDNSISKLAINGLQADLDLKADDIGVVKLTGAQSIAGQKTFTTGITLPTGSLNINAINGSSTIARTSQANTFEGTQKFNNNLSSYARFFQGNLEIYAPPPNIPVFIDGSLPQGIDPEKIFDTNRLTGKSYLNELTLNKLNVGTDYGFGSGQITALFGNFTAGVQSAVGVINDLQAETLSIINPIKAIGGLDLSIFNDTLGLRTASGTIEGASSIETENIQINQNLNFSGNINSISTIELNYLSGITSNIQAQINSKTNEEYVNTQIANLVNTAPESLNTLNELSNALGADPNFSTTMTNLIGTKVATSLYNTEKAVQNTNIANNTTAINDNLTLINTKVNTTTYDSEKAIQNTNIANNTTAINDNTTLINTKVNTTTYNTEKAIQNTNIANNTTAINDNLTLINTKVNTTTYDTEKAIQNSNIANNTTAINDNLTLINTKVNTTTYDTEKAIQNTNIANNTTAINNNTTLINTKVDTTTYDTEKAIQNTNISTLQEDLNDLSIFSASNYTSIQDKVDTSTYNTEKAVQNTNISNNTTSINNNTTLINNNTTLINSKLSITDYNTQKATQDALIATKTTELYVDTAISNLVNGAGSALDTLNELSNALGNDPNFATTISTQIGTKLSTSTYTTDKATIDSRLDNIESVDTLQQTAIDDRLSKSSGGVVSGDLSLRSIINLQEKISTSTISTNQLNINYSNGSVFVISGLSSATNFEILLTNINPTSSTNTSCIITLLIDTSTYEAYGNSCKVNGTIRAIFFNGGASSIDITGASMVQQTLAIVYSGSSGVPLYVMSSVVPYMA